MDKPSKKHSSLFKYAGLATQFLAGIGISLWLGLKADKLISPNLTFLVWFFPLLIIAYYLYRIIKDTSPKR